MPCTLSQAHDQILALLPSAVTALAVHYPDEATPAGFPPATASWARISITDVDQERPPPLCASTGGRRYTTNGLLTIELYVLSGSGRTASDALAEAVLAAFRGKYTSGGVWFRRERVNDVGADGPWWHVNVLLEYQYDTIQ